VAEHSRVKMPSFTSNPDTLHLYEGSGSFLFKHITEAENDNYSWSGHLGKNSPTPHSYRQ
jgi:hypothetical protein